jgi:thiol-disulfide isomerase/thioredoxin
MRQLQKVIGVAWLGLVIGLAATLGTPRTICAAAKGEASPAKPDPFKVPDGKPEELLQYILGLRQVRPEATDEKALLDFQKKLHRAVVEAASKVLSAQPNERQAQAAARYKTLALINLSRLEDADAAKQLAALPDELGRGGWKDMARETRSFVLLFKLNESLSEGLDAVEKPEFQKLAEEVKQHVTAGSTGPLEVNLATTLTRVLEFTGDAQRTAATYREFGKVFSASSEPEIAKLGAKMEGAARRILLVGQKLHLEGKYLDGSSFDWTKLKDKVVLVQFWATWCKPCRTEMVNIKRAYERYHDKGFEVLGINLDEKRETVTEFLAQNPLPWDNLFSDDPAANGMDHPMATYYGVMGIPQLILVGKDGKVVSLEMRAQQLDRELEKLLGAGAEKSTSPSR